VHEPRCSLYGSTLTTCVNDDDDSLNESRIVRYSSVISLHDIIDMGVKIGLNQIHNISRAVLGELDGVSLVESICDPK